MKVRVKDIKVEGLEAREDFTPANFGFTDKDIIQFVKPISVTANLEKYKNTVIAHTKASSKFSSFCARCLEEVKDDLNLEFDLDFAITPATEFVELDEDIRQEVVLNLPAKILCSEGCKGLCKDCGANLNKEKCKCHK